MHGAWHTHLPLDFFKGSDGVAEGNIGRQIEG